MYLSEDSQKCMYTKGAIYSVFIENSLGKVIILSKMFEFERFIETITSSNILVSDNRTLVNDVLRYFIRVLRFLNRDLRKTRDILYIFYILTDKRINIWR